MMTMMDIKKKPRSGLTIAKTRQGELVEVVRVVEKVGFSDAVGWVLLCFDFEKQQWKQEKLKWVPASTQFVWVKQFIA